MTETIQPMSRFSGDVFVAELTGDVPGHERFLGHMPTFSLGAPSFETLEEKGANNDNAGNTIFSENTGQSQSWSGTTKTISGGNLALALYGEQSVWMQSAGSDGTPVDLVAKLGMRAKLAVEKLDPGTPPVITNIGATVTYVENLDYVIDYKWGMVYFMPDGAIAEDEPLKITKTWLAITGGEKISGLTAATKRYQIRLIGQNRTDNTQGMLVIPKTGIAPAGDISFIDTAALMQFDLTGAIEQITGQDPYSFYRE